MVPISMWVKLILALQCLPRGFVLHCRTIILNTVYIKGNICCYLKPFHCHVIFMLISTTHTQCFRKYYFFLLGTSSMTSLGTGADEAFTKCICMNNHFQRTKNATFAFYISLPNLESVFLKLSAKKVIL